MLCMKGLAYWHVSAWCVRHTPREKEQTHDNYNTTLHCFGVPLHCWGGTRECTLPALGFPRLPAQGRSTAPTDPMPGKTENPPPRKRHIIKIGHCRNLSLRYASRNLSDLHRLRLKHIVQRPHLPNRAGSSHSGLGHHGCRNCPKQNLESQAAQNNWPLSPKVIAHWLSRKPLN